MAQIFLLSVLLVVAGASARKTEKPVDLAAPNVPTLNGTFSLNCYCFSPYSCPTLFGGQNLDVVQDYQSLAVFSGEQGLLNGKVDPSGAVGLHGFPGGVYSTCNGTYARGALTMNCLIGQQTTAPQCYLAMTCASGMCLDAKPATTGVSHPFFATTGFTENRTNPFATSAVAAAQTSGVAALPLRPNVPPTDGGDTDGDFTWEDSESVRSSSGCSPVALVAIACCSAAACLCLCLCVRRCCRMRRCARRQLPEDRAALITPASRVGSQYPAAAAAAVQQHRQAAAALATSTVVAPAPAAPAPQTTQTQQFQGTFFYPGYPPMPYYPHPGQQQFGMMYPAPPQMQQAAQPAAAPVAVAPPAPQLQRAHPTGLPAVSALDRRPNVDTSSDEQLARALQAQYNNEASFV